MKVVHLSTYDVLGGAARSAWRLHLGLQGCGVQSRMLVRVKASKDPAVAVIPTPKPAGEGQMQRWTSLADRLINRNRTDRSGIFFTLPVPGYDLARHPAVQEADLIHLHWIYSLVAPEGIQRLLQLGRPVVWTLHDQRPFTGGCHFSFGCEGFTTDCSGCPELRDNNAELTRWMLADALRAVDPSPIVVVSPSRWLAQCAQRSTFFRHNRIDVIPYGLETEVFQPKDRQGARSALGLPPDSFVLLFGADFASEKRKGFAVLLQALQRCRSDAAFAQALTDGRVRLLSFGKGMEHVPKSDLPVQSLGYVDNDARLAEIFSAADLLLCPTLDDNLPNVIMEARACGTPVLASRVGGVPELVTPGENGELFAPGNARELSARLLGLWREPERLKQLSVRSRKLAGAGLELALQARRYLELYEDLLKSPRPKPTLPDTADPLPLAPAVWPQFYNVAGAGSPDELTLAAAGPHREADSYYLEEQGNGWRPTYSGPQLFLSSQHERIWNQVKGWDGWPDETECRKLYELGFHAGSVILENEPEGGRGTMAALKGALAANPQTPPQYYAASRDLSSLTRTARALGKAGLSETSLLYHGNIAELLSEIPIVPALVIIHGPEAQGGSGCHLQYLRWALAPGSMVLCFGYPQNETVRHAVDGVLRTAQFEFMGLFSRSVLLRATGACRQTVRGLPPALMPGVRAQLQGRYERTASRNGQAPVADAVGNARDTLVPLKRHPNGRGPWPYAPLPGTRPLPATLPGGKPWPRITVVTPSFNQGKYLEHTLLSVLNQGYPNLEYIVMDGGSTDGSAEILHKYGPRLTYWASEKDRGQCDAINKGMARATGDILTWVNSDDKLAPGALAAVAMAFHTSGADMVAGICQLLQDGVIINQHLTSCPDGPLPLDRLLDQENCWEQGHFFYQPEVFFTRELWQRAGGRLDESLYFSLDYELWLRFAKAGARLKVIGVPLAIYRVHEAQKTFHAEKFLPELRKVRDTFLGVKAERKPAPKAQSWKHRLKIAVVNDVGFRFGAGIAHQRLSQALACAGHEIVPLASSGVQIVHTSEAQRLASGLLKRLRAAKPDLVLVGNVHSSRLDAAFLERVAEEWPTVLITHDTWTFTGRCAYTGNCRKYLTGCDASCPTAEDYPALKPEEIQPAWLAKRQLLAKVQGLVVATNSEWLRRKGSQVLEALRADGPSPQVQLRRIRYGLPLDKFYPRDPDMCREILGLPRDKFLLFFCCTHVEDTRKGTAHLIEALLRLQLPDLVPVCLGAGADHLRAQLPGLIGISYASEPHRQAMLYSAADLFVAPSLEEAFGQVFIEAAACGTPSLAYAVDGVPEALKDGVSGILVSKPHPSALAEAIRQLYYQPQLRRDLGVWGACWVRGEFSFAASYHTLFPALRDALAHRGVHLSENVCILPQTVTVPEPTYLIPPAVEPSYFQKQLESYFQARLDAERNKPWPWLFNPRAWLARINRNELRRHGAPSEPRSSL